MLKHPKDYLYECFYRTKLLEEGERPSGGILLYLHEALKHQISVYGKSSEDILWVMLKSGSFRNTENNFLGVSIIVLKTLVM